MGNEKDDAKCNEVFHGIWIDVGHPINDAKSDKKFGNDNGGFDKQFCKEVCVCSVHPIEVFSANNLFHILSYTMHALNNDKLI